MKRILFFVPHEDDEVFVGGGLLVQLARSNEYDVHIYIATNGDYYPEENEKRITESIDCLSTLGLELDHIHFGGYGDCWKGKHIYNSSNNEIKESQGGFTHTYLKSNLKQEWHYERTGTHCDYTRDNYKKDITDVILTLLPDVIIGVDMDQHRDHRALSLLIDEALCDIIKSTNKNYCPVLLKKFAYESVLFGKQDFFEYPHPRTVHNGENMPNPFLKWGDRVSYKVPSDCNTLFLRNNFIYKLIKKHKSQNMWLKSESFINSDIVYWIRNVNNEAINAQITVSSGNEKYLNDFKLVDSDDINSKQIDFAPLCWRPIPSDIEPSINIIFYAPKIIRYFNIYFNSPGGIDSCLLELRFYNNKNEIINFKKIILSFDEDFKILKLNIDNVSDCILVEMVFKGDIRKLGIAEIEIMDDLQKHPFDELLYDGSQTSMKIVKRALLKLDKNSFRLQKLLFKWFSKRNK